MKIAALGGGETQGGEIGAQGYGVIGIESEIHGQGAAQRAHHHGRAAQQDHADGDLDSQINVAQVQSAPQGRPKPRLISRSGWATGSGRRRKALTKVKMAALNRRPG